MTRKTAAITRAVTAAFAVVGVVNVAAVVLPTRFGDANWELAAFGELAGTFGVTLIGLGLVAFVSAWDNRFWLATIGSLVGSVLGVIALLGILLAGLNLPLVMQSTGGGGVAETQLRLLAAKTMALLLLYGFGCWYLTVNLVQTAVHSRRMAAL